MTNQVLQIMLSLLVLVREVVLGIQCALVTISLFFIWKNRKNYQDQEPTERSLILLVHPKQILESLTHPKMHFRKHKIVLVVHTKQTHSHLSTIPRVISLINLFAQNISLVEQQNLEEIRELSST